MPTDAKRQAVTDLAELLRGSSALAVADYRGLTVSEMHTVRRALRANGVSLKIAKNRLLKIAADEAGLAELKPMLEGPTAIAATSGDEASLARALQDAFRPYKVVSLRGGLLAGRPVNAADLQRLATLPSREVLLARLAGGMAAPLTGMAGVLAANLRNFVGVLSAVADQRREAEGAGAATPDGATAAATTEVAGSTEEAGSPETSDTLDTADSVGDAGPVEPAETADADGTAETEDSTEDVPAEAADSTDDVPTEAESAEPAAPAEDADTSPSD